MFYRAKYKNWVGITCLVKVEVKETQVWDERLYYALNLDILGCGVDEATPELAIKALIADHGQFINATVL